jgi:hypothetical protein
MPALIPPLMIVNHGPAPQQCTACQAAFQINIPVADLYPTAFPVACHLDSPQIFKLICLKFSSVAYGVNCQTPVAASVVPVNGSKKL